jgi:hypothetical protein
MDLFSHPYPFAYYKGRAITFSRDTKTRASFFGGPSELKVSGMPHGPASLHHLATIDCRDFGMPLQKFGASIPFLHGMNFEACGLEYRPEYGRIEVTQIEPPVSEDGWPYFNYPKLLPYFPLRVEESIEMPLEVFSSAVMQGVRESSSETLIVVIPPNPMLGVSLWGNSGDMNEVQVIFTYDVDTGIMRSYDACT